MPNTFRLLDLIRIKESCKVLTRQRFKIIRPALVSKAGTIARAVQLIDGLADIKKGDKVLVKPNINSDDTYPGTSRIEGMIEIVRLLQKKGADVTIGDMSSAFWHNTRKCAESVGIVQACTKEDIPIIFFEDYEWIKTELPSTNLKYCQVTSAFCNFDHIVNLAVLKTHRLADFTLSMKNLMGCLHIRTRMRMHTSIHFKEMIGEFQKAITPVLNILDGTKSFIDGGPDKGELREPGIVLASRDRVALDVTGVRELQKLGSKSLAGIDPWTHPQIIGGVKAGIGVSKDEDIKIINRK